MRLRGVLVLAATAAVLSHAFALPVKDAENDAALGRDWFSHVQYLADDSMKGRLTGSPEYLKAAAYVVDQFKSYGLKPAGERGGFYQDVHFDVQRVIAAKSSLKLISACRTCADHGAVPLVLGVDATLGSRAPQLPHVEAPLVFVGYGLHLPEQHYDDFDSAEVPFASLKGKIVVYINGGPAELPGALKSFARTAPLAAELARAGVVGTISIPTPKSMDFPWERVASSASQPGMRLASTAADKALARRHPALADQHRAMFAATFNPAQAEKLFAGTGHSFAEMLALADAQKPLPRFALNKSIAADVTSESTQVTSPNVVAMLQGSDPALAREYVMVSAHLDHLGVGEPIHGKTIYPGAMDDASGVATVLEVAKQLAAAPTKPKRSILFLVFTAEEKGLLGSRFYAGHPTVPEGSIIADLNSDMPMPIFALKKLHVQGLEQSTLADDARAVGAAQGIEIAADPEPDRNSFVRTDQYSFVQAGIPALAFKFGWTMGSPEYKAWRTWLAQRYHSTDDDLTQPFDQTAAAQYTRFITGLAVRVADDAGKPHYLESSFFRRFETGE